MTCLRYRPQFLQRVAGPAHAPQDLQVVASRDNGRVLYANAEIRDSASGDFFVTLCEDLRFHPSDRISLVKHTSCRDVKPFLHTAPKTFYKVLLQRIRAHHDQD